MTFDFVLDAFPDYTKFDGTKKVLATIQVVESDEDESVDLTFARRGHCNTLEEASKIVPPGSAGFDHWSTYGVQDKYATAGANGTYTNTNYYDAQDTEAKRLHAIKLGSLSEAATFRAGSASGAEITDAKMGSTIYVDTTAEGTITVTTETGATVAMTGKTFTMPDGAVTVSVAEE